MNRQKLEDGIRILHEEIRNLKHSRFTENKDFIQHGTTTLYQHCISVAYRSIIIASKFNLDVDMRSLVRGALLHDYFLYDWHEKDYSHRLHGFHHSPTALRNAKKDFSLSQLEENIIERHMFPLTPKPPRYKEAWIICVADKACSLQETFKLGTSFWKPVSFI